MSIKTTLYKYCEDYVQKRIEGIQEEITRAQTSANEETKSSAGDKYETGRAMAQLEVERNTQQLREAEKLEAALHSIPHTVTNNAAGVGNLITTSKGIFFIAISIGVVKIKDVQYFIVSPESPIGKLIIGRKAGESFTFNKQEYTIMTIE